MVKISLNSLNPSWRARQESKALLKNPKVVSKSIAKIKKPIPAKIQPIIDVPTSVEKSEKQMQLDIINSLTLKNESYLTKSSKKFIALDCEMVGGLTNKSLLARVSIVDYNGSVLLDLYVIPNDKIGDYRTKYSGITKRILDLKGIPFNEAINQVSDCIKDKIVIGHGLKFDFACLNKKDDWFAAKDEVNKSIIKPTDRNTRDTSTAIEFIQKYNKGGKSPSLKWLALNELGLVIQEGSHSSVEDARVAMLLWRRLEKIRDQRQEEAEDQEENQKDQVV